MLQVTMHVCVFVFDLLYVDGDSLVHLPLRQRRARLAAALPNLQPGHVQLATSMEFQPATVSAAAISGASADPATAAAAAQGNSAQSTAAGATATVDAASSACGNGTVGVKNPAAAKRVAATGGGDINATAEAAATAASAVMDPGMQAADTAPQQAAADQAQDASAEAAPAADGAADTEDVVSDLVIQSIEDRIQEFLLESFAGGTEGLMLKALDVAAGYQPSKRSDSWIKLKRCVVSQLAARCVHSFDHQDLVKLLPHRIKKTFWSCRMQFVVCF